MEAWGNFVGETLCRFIGQTVTIFTTSGGLSGAGFTGVLLSIDRDVLRLLCDIGEAPACPIGSNCTCGRLGCCGPERCNPLGAICVIPVHAVACFTHNAIA